MAVRQEVSKKMRVRMVRTDNVSGHLPQLHMIKVALGGYSMKLAVTISRHMPTA